MDRHRPHDATRRGTGTVGREGAKKEARNKIVPRGGQGGHGTSQISLATKRSRPRRVPSLL